MTRGKDYYRKFFQDIESDPIEEGDLEKLIKFIALLGDKTDDDDDDDEYSNTLIAYDTMDPEDFLKLALGEESEGSEDDNGEDDNGEDDSPWRFNVDEEHDAAGGEGIDSVGDNEDESEDKEEGPDGSTVSDESEKKKVASSKKGSGCVSDKGMKKVLRKKVPNEEQLTRSNIAATLKDLRF